MPLAGPEDWQRLVESYKLGVCSTEQGPATFRVRVLVQSATVGCHSPTAALKPKTSDVSLSVATPVHPVVSADSLTSIASTPASNDTGHAAKRACIRTASEPGDNLSSPAHVPTPLASWDEQVLSGFINIKRSVSKFHFGSRLPLHHLAA
eukprot:CAMPEP_0119101544 /NCGR_PEP_ID=MMETSP1180-20130426/578_1 /TAXON_ID=3052 ORGANISM="Chlamydomonas cf sp, Strain CCMP681" /NCGR_SAMPLE_ID=MMETSP1180 /ASSEMBLY_ACC=CAM_ASM_000741 /LENGTH=149 /DNA_ID=CAMNT_0007085683 /DNA_START=281 /DNA_END=730 /DNA_ORIENTATION=+